jgi:long-chain acyl-CoA synthetase
MPSNSVLPPAKQLRHNSGMPELWNNFYDRFAATADRFGNHVAIELQHHDSVERITYAALRNRAEAAAVFLASHNIQAGDTCAILADNEIAWCAAYLGILYLGALAVPLDTHYSPTQIATLLRHSSAKILFTTDRYLAGVEEARRLADSSVRLVLLHGHGSGVESLEGIRRSECGPTPAHPADSQAPAVILYTSGTTSDPKGVVLTHANLLAEAEAVFSSLQLDERDSILGVMPLYHALAQMGNLLLPFVVGARVIFIEEVSSSALLSALRQFQPTVFCCVPQFFYLIHERLQSRVAEGGKLKSALFRLLLSINGLLRQFSGLNIGPTLFSTIHDVLGRKMRFLVTGGARFDPSIGRDFYRLGFNLIEAYGLTETSGAATLTRIGEGGQGSVGQPLHGVEVKILPDETAPEDGLPGGEIAIRGSIVMKGYFHRPDATAEVLKDGWLLTGDLGYLDPHGRLSVTGRKKEVIVLSSGKNIYPEEIEAHYAQSPYIKELCILGHALPGEPAAERLHAVIVPDLEVMQARKVLNMKEVLRFDIENLSIHLPAHKRILSYEVKTEPLPRTTTRKLKRYEIERHLQGQAEVAKKRTPDGPPSKEEATWAADPLIAQALQLLREASHDKNAVCASANLELDLGLDSIERVEVLTNLEQLFGVNIPDEVAQSTYTVRQLVDAVRSRASEPASFRPVGAWEKLFANLPEDEPLFKNLLKPHRVATLLAFVILKFASLLARYLLRFRVAGLENLPANGAFLICPNHESYLDPFLLVSALPYSVFRKLFFVGASEYFATPLRAKAARLMHLVSLDPDTNLLCAMQAGAFGLQHAMVLVLFPEGERSIDAEVKKFKKGAAILSTHLQVPIIPVAIRGTFSIWPRNRAIFWKSFLPWTGTRVNLQFGSPMQFASQSHLRSYQTSSEADYAAFAESLRQAVVDLRSTLSPEPSSAQPH